MQADTVNRLALRVVAQLWPRVTIFPEGYPLDRQGVDALGEDGISRIQIKGDQRMYDSGKVYVQRWKRTFTEEKRLAGGEDGKWRRSPDLADEYIFVSMTCALRVDVSILSDHEVGRTLQEISKTSRGFLIPFKPLITAGAEYRAHTIWMPPSVRNDVATLSLFKGLA